MAGGFVCVCLLWFTFSGFDKATQLKAYSSRTSSCKIGFQHNWASRKLVENQLKHHTWLFLSAILCRGKPTGPWAVLESIAKQTFFFRLKSPCLFTLHEITLLLLLSFWVLFQKMTYTIILTMLSVWSLRWLQISSIWKKKKKGSTDEGSHRLIDTTRW